MPSIDPHSYTILYQVTLMAAFAAGQDGNDFQCDEKRSENFHWKEGDTVT
jgi:hypothetical protein